MKLTTKNQDLMIASVNCIVDRCKSFSKKSCKKCPLYEEAIGCTLRIAAEESKPKDWNPAADGEFPILLV